MKTKVYRVMVTVGRKRMVVFESFPFFENDGTADMNAFHDAREARETECMKLWKDGFCVDTQFGITNRANGHRVGRVELERCTK